ncbi:MAG: hypothetical protein PHH54_02040 [Candidatus Nanoarchaeia archaeon]|nr:hypothetical protein [Candidatus Nanoarchaeia archaeon]MDD5740743.1 hypothetical protein [Candidatus Nanoarchaeia archaeon]
MRKLTSLLAGLILGISAGSFATYHVLKPESSLVAAVSGKNSENNSVNKNNDKNPAGVFEIEALKIKLPEIKLDKGLDIEDSFIISYASEVGGCSWKMPINASDYFKYKRLKHRGKLPFEYVSYVTYNDPTIIKIAKDLTKNCKSKEESAQVLLDLVHNQLYDTSGEGIFDYVKFPLETLVERNGDCEDLSILGAALMKSIGIDVALINYSPLELGKFTGHMALGVNGNFNGAYFENKGVRYYYAESTGTDWLNNKSTGKIGNIPEDYKKKKVALYIVK